MAGEQPPEDVQRAGDARRQGIEATHSQRLNALGLQAGHCIRCAACPVPRKCPQCLSDVCGFYGEGKTGTDERPHLGPRATQAQAMTAASTKMRARHGHRRLKEGA